MIKINPEELIIFDDGFISQGYSALYRSNTSTADDCFMYWIVYNFDFGLVICSIELLLLFN